MNKTKWKEIALYGLAVVAAKGQFVGCYPLIPGFFAAAFMEEVNRTLLLVFSIFGMALFVTGDGKIYDGFVGHRGGS